MDKRREEEVPLPDHVRNKKKHLKAKDGHHRNKRQCVKVDTPVVEVHHDDVPDYMKVWNPFITKGYRLCRRKRDAFLSLFYWHNCWLDTWTALGNIFHATILFLYVLALDVDSESYYVFFAFYLTCLLHSPPSTAYHLIGCSGKSYKDYLFYQRADFLMIFVSSIPLAFSLGYFTFYFRPWLLYVSVLGVVTCASYVAYIVREHMTAVRRVRLISVLVTFYLLPVLYQIAYELLFGSLTSASLWWGISAITALGAGAYAYAMKFPECVKPDFWLSSHSCMHLMVNLAYFSEFMFILSRYHAHQDLVQQNIVLQTQTLSV